MNEMNQITKATSLAKHIRSYPQEAAAKEYAILINISVYESWNCHSVTVHIDFIHICLIGQVMSFVYLL
jgi:hypothetical protein